MKLEFSEQMFEKVLISSFVKIHPFGAELFPADRRTDRHDEVNSRFSQFCERAYERAFVFLLEPWFCSVKLVSSRRCYSLQEESVQWLGTVGAKIFLFSKTSRPDLGLTYLSFQWVPGSLPGVKLPVRAVDHSPPSTARLLMILAVPPLFLYAFMA